MGFWSGIANAGLAYQGATDVLNASQDRDYLERKRKRDDEVANMALEEARRQDELGKQVRALAKKYGLGGESQLPTLPGQEVPVAGQLPVDDEGNAMPKATIQTPGVAAQANQAGMREAMAQAYEGAGKLSEADQLRKAAAAIKAEGYGEIVKGVASGEDPTAIAQRFNQKGDRRIVNGQKNGDSYVFTYEDGKTQTLDKATANDLGMKLGMLKKDTTILPEGASLVENGSGTVIARGQPKARNMDPYGPEAIKAKKDLEDYKAKLAKEAGGGAKGTALIQNIDKIASEFGIPWSEAYQMSRVAQNKPLDEKIIDTAVRLKRDDLSGRYDKDPGKAIEDARGIVEAGMRAATKAGAARTATANPKPAEPAPLNTVAPDPAASKATGPQVPQTARTPDGKVANFTGQFTRQGKPIYQVGNDPKSRFVGE